MAKKKLDSDTQNIINELGTRINIILNALDYMEKDEKYFQLAGRIFAKSLENNIDFILGERWEPKEILKGLEFQLDIDRFNKENQI
jgi:hypothetical protein